MKARPVFLYPMLLAMLGFFGVYYYSHRPLAVSQEYIRESQFQHHTVPGPQCNVTAFNQLLDLDSSPPRVPRELLADCSRVFYNRVPKCASRTVYSLFDRQAAALNFTNLFINDEWVLKEEQIEEVYLRPMRANDKFTLTSHFYFRDFSKFYPDVISFVNVIRDPVSMFESTFYWKKYGSVEDPHSAKNYAEYTTIEACLANQTCLEKLRFAFGPISFMCGPSPICGDREAAVTEAIRNTDRSYIAVGLYEDLPSFLEILEYLMPHMFSGLLNNYATYALDEKQKTQTIQKENLTKQTKQQMEGLLEREYRFYNYTKTRMYKLLHAVRYLKQNRL